MTSLINELETKIQNGYRLGYDEAVDLMHTWSCEDLYELAHRLRTRYQGRKIDMCSIINARSGRCSENCKWCAQSRFYKTDIAVYPLVDEAQTLAEASHNAAKGVNRFSMVTSGRTLSERDTEHICEIYTSLKKNVKIRLCASLGLLNREQLVKLRESGVERYHCNLETAPSFFSMLCSTHTTAEKLQTIAWAREVGMSICSGGIIGMGETAEQRIEFAIAVRDAGAVSIPVNVLNPIAGTPLEDLQPLTEQEVLTTIAMTRILNPEADIRLAGGRTVIRAAQEQALRCGVSALIVGDMLTTAGMDIDSDKAMFEKYGFLLDSAQSGASDKIDELRDV